MTDDELIASNLRALKAVLQLPTETNWDGGWEDADAFQHGYMLAMGKVFETIKRELG